MPVHNTVLTAKASPWSDLAGDFCTSGSEREFTLKGAGVPYFRLYDLRSTYATWLSAGGVADEWVIQIVREGDSQVFKKYSQMKLQLNREALDKINCRVNEMSGVLTQQGSGHTGFDTVLTQ